MSVLQSINPSDYQVLGEIAVSSASDIAGKVQLARGALVNWKNLGLETRIRLLQNVFADLQERKFEFALLQSREMGMPINEALIDFDMNCDFAKWYFNNAEQYLKPEITFESHDEIHQVIYEPIGVAAVIVPWNCPFANFVWGALQSLIVGNTVVFKHSEETPLSGQFLEEVITERLPLGVFNEVYGDGEVGKLLVQQDINMIAFTGSTRTGKFLYETAGEKFIKAVVELGGSAPGVIFADANVDAAVKNVCEMRLLNAGQICDGLKRLIVHESILPEVVEKVSAVFADQVLGKAEEKTTTIGPLVAKRQLDLLMSQLQDAQEKGAKAIVGGSSLEDQLGGVFVEPTVLTNITRDMRVWKEEVFGPVLPIVSFKTEKEAIELANQTSYGLGAYVYTEDPTKADRVAQSLESGLVSVNSASCIMPYNPFGGYKNSGMGREHGKYGFHEVTQVKVIAKNK